MGPDFVAGLTVTHSDSANSVPHSIWVGWQVEQVSISNPHDLGFLVGYAEKCSVLSTHTFQKHFGGRGLRSMRSPHAPAVKYIDGQHSHCTATLKCADLYFHTLTSQRHLEKTF
jgi:hypothetical protein